MVIARPIGLSTAQQRDVELEKTREKQRSIERGQRLLALQTEFEKEGMIFTSNAPIGASEEEVIHNLDQQLQRRREQRVKRPGFDAVQSQGRAPLGRQIEAGLFGITAPLSPIATAGVFVGGTALSAAAGLAGNPRETLDEVRDRGGSTLNPVDIAGAAFKTSPGLALAGEIVGGGIGGLGAAAPRAVARAATLTGKAGVATGKAGVAGAKLAPDIARQTPGATARGTKALLIPSRRASSKGIFTDLPSVSKLTDILRVAKPARLETELLKTGELGRRTGNVARAAREALDNPGDVSTARGRFRGVLSAARKQQEGELPKADFQSPEELGFSLEDGEEIIQALFKADAGVFGGELSRINTVRMFADVFGQKLPTSGDIQTLARLFGDDFASALKRHQSRGRKSWEAFMQVVGIPRTIMAGIGFDFLRQARPLLTPLFLNPRGEEAKLRARAIGAAFKSVIKSAGSDESAELLWRAQMKDPEVQLGMRKGLQIVGPGGKFSGQVSGRTEGFVSNYTDYIPVLGPIIRFSERTNASFFNTLRIGMFKGQMKNWRELDELRKVDPRAGDAFFNVPGIRKVAPGENFVNDRSVKTLARYLNTMSGRGNIPAWMNKHADIMNVVFFSPRFTYRAFEAPFSLLSRTPAVRRMAARDLTGMVMTGVGILAAAKAAGLDVEMDPRSSDFGRIRHKSIRYDFWGGFRPLAVLIGRMAANPEKPFTGETKSTGTGLITEQQTTSLLLNYFRAKTSPQLGLVIDVSQGETVIGEEVLATKDSVLSQAEQRLLPLVVQDVKEALENEGILGAAGASTALFGIDPAVYLTQQDIVNPYLETSIKVTAPDGSRITDFTDERLSPSQRTQILSDPRVKVELKRIKTQRTQDALQVERAAAQTRRKVSDQRLKTGEKSGRQWRQDLLMSRLVSAAQARARRSLEGPFNRSPRNPNERALNEYYEIVQNHVADPNAVSEIDPAQISRLSASERELLDRAFDVSGFVEATDQFLSSLDDEQRQFVLDNVHPDRTPTEHMYYEAQRLLKRYWEIPRRAIRDIRVRKEYEQYLSLPGNLQRAFLESRPRLARAIEKIDTERQRLRQRNRSIDDALVLFYDLVPANSANLGESRRGANTQRTRGRVIGRGPDRLARSLRIEF